ncbi:MAG: alpha/beta hydrolase [Chloroflexi bacterium]|nr:alpha/beta hydrolase [Chloroflexota bacterium]
MVRTFDVVYRRDSAMEWLALVYQPEGSGPFPPILYIHGGQWSGGSRMQSELINQTLAEAGFLVVGVDFRLAPDHKYPAPVEDVNYATRWLRAHARDFNGNPELLGGLGTSSGGHTMMLSALQPTNPRFAALPLPEAPDITARLDYVIACWAVLDAHFRYLYAQRSGREDIIRSSEGYFGDEQTMREGSPQFLLDSGAPVEFPPLLIIQGTADQNIPLEIPKRFAASYLKRGGYVEMETFLDMPHMFANNPGPESDRAHGLMKAFTTRQVNKVRA